jgi:TolB protein
MTEKGSKRLTEGYIPLSFPDGSKIAFLRDKIYTINIDGSGLEQITDNKVGEIGWFPYDLSPDGLRFVYCTEGGYWDKDFIWVVNSDGSGEKTILSNMWDPFDPVWSPNGSKVAFSAIARDSSGCTSYTVHIVDADGSNLIRIYKPYTHDTHPLWSPDGSRILFGSLQYREDDQEDLWIMDADGSNQRRLTYNHCVEPEWSPDGSKIVYMCDEGWTTAWQRWIMDADGSNQTKLTHLNVGAGHPKWQPNR